MKQKLDRISLQGAKEIKLKIIFTLDLERALLRPRRPVTSCEQNNNRIVNNTSQRIMAEFDLFHTFSPQNNLRQLTH